jgi:hypothetical protein
MENPERRPSRLSASICTASVACSLGCIVGHAGNGLCTGLEMVFRRAAPVGVLHWLLATRLGPHCSDHLIYLVYVHLTCKLSRHSRALRAAPWVLPKPPPPLLPSSTILVSPRSQPSLQTPVTLHTERHPPLSQHFRFHLPYPLCRKPTSTQTSRIQATALPLPVPPNPQVLSFSCRECLQFPFIVPLTPGFEADLRPCIGAALHPWP